MLLNTYNHHDTETMTHFIFSIFVSMSRPTSIYVVSFVFSLIFIDINQITSLTCNFSLMVLLSICLIFCNFSLALLIKVLLIKNMCISVIYWRYLRQIFGIALKACTSSRSFHESFHEFQALSRGPFKICLNFLNWYLLLNLLCSPFQTATTTNLW